MRIEEWDLVHDIVVRAATELFDALELPLTYTGPVPHREARWAETLSLIGLGGRLRGSLVLSAPVSLVARSHPTGADDADSLNDWLAEMANLLLGRIKARLYLHGVGIELSTPLTISAVAFRFERFAGTPVVHSFDLKGETVLVVFEGVADPDLRLVPLRGEAAVAPGELVAF
jgi:hypothetical protein